MRWALFILLSLSYSASMKRMLFVYLFSQYQNEESIEWLRNTTEQWADAMLKQNN